jgi:hypothetical protein
MSDITAGQAVAAPLLGPAEHRAPSPVPLIASAEQLTKWERLGWLLMAVLLVIGLPLAFKRAVNNGPDLAGFCDAGRYILQHGMRDPDSTLSRYWPSADVPWIPISLLPISLVAVLWYALNGVAWLGLLRTICDRLLVNSTSESTARFSENPSTTARRHATLAAGLLAMPLVLDGMALGSFHVLMIWLMLLGLDLACRGRTVSGGVLLGTAAWLKLLPMLGIGFLLLHRQWKASAIALATVVVLEVGLSVAAFGPAGAWREHVLWWQQGAQGTANRQLTADKPVDEDRLTNQSVAITLRRLLTSLGTTDWVRAVPSDAAQDDHVAGATRREITPTGRIRRQVQIANLSGDQLQGAYLIVSSILFLAVALYCRPVEGKVTSLVSMRRSAGRFVNFAPSTFPPKLVMLSLATLWFSPVTWSYHFVAATPAMASLLLRARYRWAWVIPVFVVWCAGLCLLVSDTMRAASVLLWMSLLIGIGMVVYPAYRKAA